MALRCPGTAAARRPYLLHPDVLAEKRRNVEILTFDDGRLAFFETSARDRFELQNLLLRLDDFFFRWLRLFFHDRFFLRRNQARRGLFDRWGRHGRRRRFSRER